MLWFKRYKLDPKMASLISAFANRVGDVLIFGIADNDSVVGIDDVKKAMEVISEQISIVRRTIKKLVKESKIVRVNGKREDYWKVL